MPLSAHESDCDRLLRRLQLFKGEYVAGLQNGEFGVCHSRISDLRAKGCVIEHKRFPNKPNGRADSRYRLVSEPGEGPNAPLS